LTAKERAFSERNNFNQINDALSRKLKDEALEQAIKRIQARRKDKAGKRPSK
jgi:Trm5-related predicted tRNA methylase